MERTKPLVLMVDGVDEVQDGGGQIISDWIPQELPKVSYMDGLFIYIYFFLTLVLCLPSGRVFGREPYV